MTTDPVFITARTSKLRWAKRLVLENPATGVSSTVPVLQQWWVNPNEPYGQGEWRDVETVDEWE